MTTSGNLKGGDTMYMNKRQYTSDCNRCDNGCGRKKNSGKCTRHTIPKEGFMLAELTLAHATSLNKALSALPFKANLKFYLK